MRIYVAGPFNADDVGGVLTNMRKGIKVCYELLTMGFSPFCPWLDYQFWLIDDESKLSIKRMKDASMKWLEISEAMLVQGDWKRSDGTRKEIRRAEELKIPIFYDIRSLCIYAKSKNYETAFNSTPAEKEN